MTIGLARVAHVAGPPRSRRQSIMCTRRGGLRAGPSSRSEEDGRRSPDRCSRGTQGIHCRGESNRDSELGKWPRRRRAVRPAWTNGGGASSSSAGADRPDPRAGIVVCGSVRGSEERRRTRRVPPRRSPALDERHVGKRGEPPASSTQNQARVRQKPATAEEVVWRLRTHRWAHAWWPCCSRADRQPPSRRVRRRATPRYRGGDAPPSAR